MSRPAPLRRHLAGLYAVSDDPWRYRDSLYEREKHADTLASLPRQHYARALEVGCSIGVLTELLGGRANQVVGLDVVPRAVELARARSSRKNARYEVADLPSQWWPGSFDLIVLSEILYYWSRCEIDQAFDAVCETLEPGGDCVLVNWLGSTGTEHSGEVVADQVTDRAAAAGIEVRTARRPFYRIDLLRMPTMDVPPPTPLRPDRSSAVRHSERTASSTARCGHPVVEAPNAPTDDDNVAQVEPSATRSPAG